MLCIQQPIGFEFIQHHQALCVRLKNLVKSWNEIPHLLIHGPEGSGKKTMVDALLYEKYGESMKEKQKFIESYFIVYVSTVHMEYHLTEKTTRTFIDDLLQRVKSINVHNASFHVIVIHGLSELSVVLLNQFKLIMDQFVTSARFIIVGPSATNLRIVNTRCLCIRVPRITQTECAGILKSLIDKGSVEDVRENEVEEIYSSYKGNLFDMLNHCQLQQLIHTFPSRKIELKGVFPIFDMLIEGIRTKNKMQIQFTINQLIVVPLDTSTIIRTLCLRIVQMEKDGESELSEQDKYEVVKLCAHYDQFGARNTINGIYIVNVLSYRLTEIL